MGAFAGTLRGLGVQPGDRVIGYLPNVAETLIAFLATASLGAVWSACAQDYAAAGAASRFAQLAPVVLVAADGYWWNGRAFDRRAEVTELQRLLPSLRATVHVRNLGLDAPPGAPGQTALSWEQAVSEPSEPRFEPAAFDAPLWVLFSSGTTGRPKGIVHGHGGIVVEHCKMLGLHLDVGPGRPLFWYTSTNWMMWNIVASGLLAGAPAVLYDGSPTYPDPLRLWQVAADHRAAVLGVSPGYLTASGKAGLAPGTELDLSGAAHARRHRGPAHRRAVLLGPRQRRAARADRLDQRRHRRRQRLRREQPASPRYGRARSPRRLLGVALESWDSDGRPVAARWASSSLPGPCRRCRSASGTTRTASATATPTSPPGPGVWRHGDWMEVTGHGSVIVTGRSDATLNRHGVRLGSADIYTAIEALPEIADSLVIGAELRRRRLLARAVRRAGRRRRAHRGAQGGDHERIRAQTSPRHVPDDVIAVPALPHTRTGKRLEVPVKRLIQGHPLDAVAGADAVDDFAALAQFTAYSGGRAGRGGPGKR